MRFYTYSYEGKVRVGVERAGTLVDLSQNFNSLLSLIEGGDDALNLAREMQERATVSHALEHVQIHAPLRPGKIFCSGLNYRSHIEENPDASFLEDPRFFIKTSDAIIGPGDAIRHPGSVFEVDYEVELAVIIGKTLFRPEQDEVMDHIFGYSILHDVSARFIQFKDRNEDMGKNFDTFAPFGPCIVTADDIPDPSKLRLRLRLNGVVMQDGTNEDWCFPLPRLLAWLAMGITLNPGDVVTTGTPAGIGYFRTPRVFLKSGDVCRLEIDKIGVLENPVIAITRPEHLELNLERH
jgi:2-keto-4-pentenoate hydratase/2-oxohepta-3-ene-1,7-dioic acid hydratase in catechol pathway